MDLSKIGVFSFLDGLAGVQTGPFARKIERLGYSALWFPEVMGRESLSFASHLLGQTETLAVATGIAVVFSYEPVAVANAARTLGELFEDRFILGLGVSGKGGNTMRGVAYEKPYSFMKDYLAQMKAAPYLAPKPKHEPPILLAGLLPKMVQLAAAETQGSHTYLTTVEQTAHVRALLGPQPWLCAEQGVMLETDPAKARSAVRQYLKTYLPIAHYVKRLKTVGFHDEDFANGGSDRLLDAIVAWGNEDVLRERIAAQFKAGATHVCILPLSPEGGLVPDERVLEALTPR